MVLDGPEISDDFWSAAPSDKEVQIVGSDLGHLGKESPGF